MNNKDLIRSLKQLKREEQAGFPNQEFLAQNKSLLMMQIKSKQEAKQSVNIRNIWQITEIFTNNNLFDYALKPALSIIVVFGVAFVSWAGAVSASYNSLPGDALYSVKIMTEKAQLKLTPKITKTSLQTEFAGRRLEEMIKIAEQEESENKQELIKKAVNGFKEQVKEVKQALEDLGEEDGVMEAAKLIDRKTQEYEYALKGIKETLSEEVKKEADDASDAVDDVGIKAIEVIVNQGDKENIESEVTERVHQKIKIVEEKVNEIEEVEDDAIVEDAAKEAKEVLDEAKEAFDNNDLITVVDKLVEAKNLANTAVDEAIATSSTLEIVENNGTSTEEAE